MLVLEDEAQAGFGVDIKQYLSEIASHTLYTENSFFRLGLSTIETIRNIEKRQKILDISLRTDSPLALGPHNYFQPPPFLNPDEIDRYIQKIKNPETRIFEELFWFWPLTVAGTDPGLELLRSGDKRQAYMVWEKNNRSPSSNGIGLHNQAVLTHFQIIEFETTRIRTAIKDPSPPGFYRMWQDCLALWKKLCEEETFWSCLADRIRQYDDPRLTTGMVRRIRSYIPFCLFLTIFRLAGHYSDSGSPIDSERLISLVSCCDWDTENLIRASQIVVVPLRDQLTTIISATKEKGEQDPIRAGKQAENFLIDCNSALLKIDRISFPEFVDHEMHDLVVETGLALAQIYANKTSDWTKSLAILSLLNQLEPGKSLKQKINSSKEYFQENNNSGDYWCGTNYYELPNPILTPLENARSYCENGKFLEAHNLLLNLLTQKEIPLAPNHIYLVNFARTFCLNRMAVKAFNTACEMSNLPLWVRDMIAQRFEIYKEKINYAAWAADNNLLSAYNSQGRIYCMACGSQTFNYGCNLIHDEGLPIVLCNSCYSKHTNFANNRMDEIKNLIKSSGERLLEAHQLNPQNRSVLENLNHAREVGQELGIEIPYPSQSQPRPGTNIKPSPAISKPPTQRTEIVPPSSSTPPKTAIMPATTGVKTIMQSQRQPQKQSWSTLQKLVIFFGVIFVLTSLGYLLALIALNF